MPDTSPSAIVSDLTAAVDCVIENAVTRGVIVGTEVLIVRDGRLVYRRAAGFADRELGIPVCQDQLFRLASMTKPVVAAAALALMDQGKLALDDTVTRWLPEFRPRLADHREPPITIRHLLTHTAGLTYGFLQAPDSPFHRLGISDGLDSSGMTLAENVDRIAAGPLLYEPGAGWSYSLATDVLGAILERIMGIDLPAVIHSLVTGPLGMETTRFVASDPTALATPYADGSPEPVRMTDPFTFPYNPGSIVFSPRRAFDAAAFPSGGVGLVGTAADYLKFTEAVRTGGEPILRPGTARAFTSDAPGDLPSQAGAPGLGWSLGVAVMRDPRAANSPVNAGTWSWGGVYGTQFWVDPVAKLSVVALTNTAIAGMFGAFPDGLRNAVYSVIPGSNVGGAR